MTSKGLFFKYMRENTKQRLWSVALTALLCFFLFPVLTALETSIMLRPDNLSKDLSVEAALAEAKLKLTNEMLNMYSIQNAMLVFILIVAAVVLAASGFSYLHSKKKTDFFHSLPISREMLYTVTCLDGILYLAVPYLVFLLAAGVMLQVKGAPFSWGTLLIGYVQHMCFFTLVYMTVVLAVILTGNLIVGLLGTGVLFSWGPGVAAVVSTYFSEYFMTFYDNGNFLLRWCERTSPVFWYGTATGSDHPTRMAVIALAVAALLFGLGMFLYRKRPSEAAGRAMAFKVSEPVIRFLLVVPITLFSGMIFRSILNDDIWTVFGLICGLLITSCLIEIIYHFDFKSLFAHKRQLVISAVAVAAIFLGFRLDVAGYDSYLPDADKVAYAGIYCDALDNNAVGAYHVTPRMYRDGYSVGMEWASQGDVADKMQISDEDGIRVLREIGAQGIETASRQRKHLNGGQDWMSETDLDSRYDSIVLSWHLNNGKTVYRNYRTINVTELREQLDSIYENQSYKLGMYPVLSLQADDAAGINYKEEEDCSHVKLPDEQTKAALLAAYQKELMALTPDMRREEMPIAEIQFKTNEMQAMIDVIRKNGGYYDTFNQFDYYPIYPSFQETIAILKQCGTEVGSKVTPENTEKIVLQYQGGKIPEDQLAPADTELGKRQREFLQNNSRRAVTITDPEQIAEILANSASDDMVQINQMAEVYQGINIAVYVSSTENTGAVSEDDLRDSVNSMEENEIGQTYTVDAGQNVLYDGEYAADYEMDESGQYGIYQRSFRYGKVPEFVKSTFGLTPELMRLNRVFAY